MEKLVDGETQNEQIAQLEGSFLNCFSGTQQL